MNYKFFSTTFGFSIWLIATLIFSFWGHKFFTVENHLLMIGFYLSSIPTLYFLTSWTFNRFNLTENSRIKSAILMATPGMIGDAFCLKFHYIIFPTFTKEQVVTLGSWVLWVYFIVLIVGIANPTMWKVKISN